MRPSTTQSYPDSRTSAETIAGLWIRAFRDMIADRAADRVEDLFVGHGSWRDLLALTWQLRSAIGHHQIMSLLTDHVCRKLTSVELRTHPASELVDSDDGAQWIQAFFTFTLDGDSAHGMVRLVPCEDEPGWKAWTLVTDLLDLQEPIRETKWSDISNPAFTCAIKGYHNWRDRRRDTKLTDRDPTVLLVGAGQCGLQLGARLDRLGIDAVIVDRALRLGDSWRNRHYNLRTHTASFADSFPYLPFPKTWPISVEKDKLADWCEFYASAMDLDVFTGQELVYAEYNPETQRWLAHVKDQSGGITQLRPKHLVLATGMLSRPRLPHFEGQERFAGEVVHSSQYRDARSYLTKKVVVVGTGASGHDIAQDLYEQGVEDVTMVQRSGTYVMSFERGVPAAYSTTYNGIYDLDISDLIFMSFPLPTQIELNKSASATIAATDQKLLEGLRAAGFQLLENTGLLELAFTPTVTGYYINQGCSELIIDGSISLKQGEVCGFDQNNVLFSDGSTLPADVVVLCTGFHPMRESVRAMLGDKVADAIAEPWVLDYSRGGEHGALWTETGYPQLWLHAGALNDSRIYSRYLALKIKAIESGRI